ncbi:MAG: serine hydrolase domain-containing protein [Sphingomicrobium sp.]
MAIPGTSAAAHETAQHKFTAEPLVRASRPEDAGFDSQRLKRLDEHVARFVASGKVAGVATLLARHGKIVQFRTYGNQAIGGAPMREDTIFRIYSMTKPITGVAMMMLFEEGKFRLDDPVTKWLPELKNLKVMTGTDSAGQPILEEMKKPPTMRQLMSHTSGFGYGLSPDSPADRLYRSVEVMNSNSMEQFIERVAKLPLLYQPGTSFQYSLSVDIQGALVERLSGQTLGAFFKQRIFAPLKMKDTAFDVPREKLPRLAGLYMGIKDNKLQDATTVFGYPRPDPSAPPGFESGGAGLYSTTMDYARFAQMLLNGGELDGVRLLAPATVNLIASNHEPKDVLAKGAGGFNEDKSYGLNVEVLHNPAAAGSLAGKGTFSWGGAAGTWFWVDPANDVIFVGMVQRFDYWEPDHPNNAARNLVYQALTRPER